MKAYHGEAAVKEKYLGRVRGHRQADELVKGCYWQGGKGCAVGCTVHSGDHLAYETDLGIPRVVARLEDGIFEELPNGEAMSWPERFLEAITPGQDLSQVGDRFVHWLLVDETDGVIRFAKNKKTRAAIERVGELYARKIKGEVIERETWVEARRAAAAAAAVVATYVYAYDAATVAAYVYAYAYDAAGENARVRQSEKLLELLRAAPMAEAA